MNNLSILPSLRGRGWWWTLVLLVTMVVGSCKSDSDEEPQPPQQETPAYLTPGSDARPNWTFADKGLFELRMSVQVELGDELAAYQSSGDLMCATIGGEIRTVAAPAETGGVIYFPLIIFDNGSGGMVSLSYYCDRLHRIYNIANWAAFNASAAPSGSSGIYRPCFTQQ